MATAQRKLPDVETQSAFSMLEFRTLAETIPSPIFASDADGGHIYTNSAYSRYSGLDAAELLGQGFLALVHDDDRADLPVRWAAIRTACLPFEAEYRLRRHDGAYRWHIVRGAPVLDANGNVLRWTGSCTDVEVLRSAALAAANAEAMLAALGTMADVIVYAKDGEGRMAFASDATLTILARDRDDVIGVDVAALANSATEAARIAENDREVVERDAAIVVEEAWTDATGQRRYYRSSKAPWHRADGTTGVVGFSLDITRERALEAAAQRNAGDLDALMNGLPLLIWLTDARGHIVLQNNVWTDMSGFPSSPDKPVEFADLIDPEGLSGFAADWAACVRDGDVLETVVDLFDRLEERYVPHRIVAIPQGSTIEDGVSGWVGSAVRL